MIDKIMVHVMMVMVGMMLLRMMMVVPMMTLAPALLSSRQYYSGDRFASGFDSDK